MSLKVSWDEYNALVERLAHKVHESGYGFNQIICIARGGLRVGDVLSRIFEQPLAILSTHSYTAKGGTLRGELVIAEHMTMTKPRLGDRVLLVDDMVDSGHTLEAVHNELPRRFPHISALRTAVLWWKACSVFRPEYYVEHLADSPWIHQPFEVYDDLTPEQLAARLAPETMGSGEAGTGSPRSWRIEHAPRIGFRSPGPYMRTPGPGSAAAR